MSVNEVEKLRGLLERTKHYALSPGIRGEIAAALAEPQGEQVPAQGFKRESRYFVVKCSDLNEVRVDVREQFLSALARLIKHHVRIPQREFVVIESDWPEYEPVWAMLEARMTGKARPAQTDQQPVHVTAVAVTRQNEDGELYLDWLLEGGICELEHPGQVLIWADREITDDEGHGEVYAAPIAQTAPQPEQSGLVDMVDRAMVEMQNIHPPMRRSDCERLIRAALAAK